MNSFHTGHIILMYHNRLQRYKGFTFLNVFYPVQLLLSCALTVDRFPPSRLFLDLLNLKVMLLGQDLDCVNL